MRRIIISINLFFIFLAIKGQSQEDFSAIQSSYKSSPTIAIDGSINNGLVSRTGLEENPFWSLNLDTEHAIEQLTIYPDGQLGYFYIFLSPYPLEGFNLEEIISNDDVTYFNVNRNIDFGETIQIGERAAYVRIQKTGFTSVDLVEVSFEISDVIREDLPPNHDPTAFIENCSDGFDNDLDGLDDCDDPDCKATLFLPGSVNPSCPICHDGQLSINISSNQPYQISIDGGETFMDACVNSYPCIITGLGEGEYNIVVTNGVCTTVYQGNPIVLRSPPGQPNTEFCENGGFELGDFTNWTGRSGKFEVPGSGNNPPPTNATPTITLNNPGFQFAQIMSNTPGGDPNVGNLIPLQGIGTFFLRLGDDVISGNRLDDPSRRNAQEVTYCLEVDQYNADFSFSYAMVMEDPNHSPQQNPFFEWEVYEAVSRITIETERRIANINDPFFQSFGNDIAYLPWTCVNVDLNNYIGTNVCFRMLSTDCAPGAHYGYTYIDGLCAASAEFLPEINITSNTTFCEDQLVRVDASGSGFTMYNWRICYTKDGIETCVEGDEIIGSVVNPIDDLAAYFNELYGSILITNQECGGSFQVQLRVSNDCAANSAFTNISVVCESTPINYKDLLICALPQDVQIVGDGCSNCQYNWSPALYLDNATIENPTILQTLNYLAYDQTYEVEATNEFGCVYTDSVTVESIEDIDQFAATIIQRRLFNRNLCTFQIGAKITFDVPNNSDDFTVFININGERHTATLVGNPGTRQMFEFILDSEEFQSGNRITYSVTLRPNNVDLDIYPDDIHVIGNCSFTRTFTVRTQQRSYYGDIPNIFLPSAMGLGPNPNHDPTNPNEPAVVWFNWRPEIRDIDWVYQDNLQFNHNLRRAKLTIFNRWGGSVLHEKELVSTRNTPFNMRNLDWDGSSNGQPQNPGVFVFVMEVENCDHPVCDCNDHRNAQSPGSPNANTQFHCINPNNCKTSFAGEITLVR